MEGIIQGQAPFLIDAIVVIIFLLFMVLKGKRGLYSSAMSVFVIVVSLALGIFVSSCLTQPIFKIVYPKIEASVSAKYEEELQAMIDEKITPSKAFSDEYDRLIESLGLSEKVSGGSANIVSMTKEIVLERTAKTTYAFIKLVLFGLFTALGMFALTIIKNFFGVIADWPVIGWVNTWGGMALGFLECYVIFFLIIRGADLIGIEFFNNISQGTVIMDFINGHKDPQELYEIGMNAVQNAKASGTDLVKSAAESAKDAAKEVAKEAANQAKDVASDAAKDAIKNAAEKIGNN